ncbi:MAG TPA: OmpH family outer membrane protein [Puia sp.]|uniref:OmpH family outer membrane protein n=1 Tax=Puia sp. TaxID=2045100 RepID=UPI002BEEF315|nr:OmpH family outer membrane protein [Puia sp.]HVU94910.1 OmpH family outer membrane protein [Puia sp.]
MKYISTILSVVALGLIGVLFFSQKSQLEQLKKHVEGEKTMAGTGFKIAYFDMDSLEAHYDYFKDAQAQVKAQENAMTQELSSLDRSNQKKVDGWRQKGNTMTQAEGEQAQREYQEMQQQFASRKQNLEQALYKSTEDLKTKIRKQIEDYLKDYNRQKNFSYIIQYDANSFIYAKDSAYNITTDVVDGLNAAYKKK